jgi:7-cyano-7-deazaguanine synthase in queuosine biosynthesis
METLLFLSGGLDSTTALLKMLRETNDNLHVHHIKYITHQGRHIAEGIAVEKIITYCRAIREFTFSTSTQDYSDIGCPYDPHVIRFTAAQLNRYRRYDRIVVGRCKNDDANASHREVTDLLYTTAMDGSAYPPSEWYYPVGNMTKYQEREYIAANDPSLLSVICSCRTPQYDGVRWVNCGKCRTCVEIAGSIFEYICG